MLQDGAKGGVQAGCSKVASLLRRPAFWPVCLALLWVATTSASAWTTGAARPKPRRTPATRPTSPARPRRSQRQLPRPKVPRRRPSTAGVSPGWTIERLRTLSEEETPLQVLRSHGVAVVSGAFEVEQLREIQMSFCSLHEGFREDVLRFGQLRGERAATHLPYQEPFSNLQLLGTDYALRDTLAGYLGEECELESAMIITVDPGAPAQNAHVDTQDEGSVSVHIPMHSLHDGFAPLGFCMGSHIDPSVLSAPPRLKLRGAERRQKAEEALHRQTRATAKEEHFLQWGPSEVALLPAVDFRRGAMRVLVRNFRDDAAEALGLQQGDEVTHVNDLDFVTWLEVKDHVPELRDNIVARVLRPVTEPNAAEALEEELPALSAAPADSSQSQAPSRLRAWFNTKRYADRMLVGAPLNIGDALIYDSRTVHWGMANCESYPRYVLYLNFKRGAFRGCSPDAIAKRSASVRCLQERGRFQDRFKRELHYMA